MFVALSHARAPLRRAVGVTRGRSTTLASAGSTARGARARPVTWVCERPCRSARAPSRLGLRDYEALAGLRAIVPFFVNLASTCSGLIAALEKSARVLRR